MKIQLIQSLFAGALLCAPLTGVQAENLDLLLSKTDGSQIRYSLKELPTLTFDEASLHVTYQGSVTDFRWTDITSYAYVESAQTGIQSSESKQQRVTYHESGITLYTPTSQPYALYTLSGLQLLQKQTGDNSHTEIRYADFESGTYILRCGSHTYKFYVR